MIAYVDTILAITRNTYNTFHRILIMTLSQKQCAVGQEGVDILVMYTDGY